MVLKKSHALREAHPEEPWLWRQDWAEGRVRTSKVGVIFLWFFAGVWTAFSVPLVWFGLLVNALHNQEDRMLWWFAIGFSVVDLFLIALAVVVVIRWRKYGRSVFEMASVPGVIGGQLAGVVRSSVKIQVEDVFRVKLICTHAFESGSGKNRHITRHTLWENEQLIAQDLLARDPFQTAIPVLFQIPYECRPTNQENIRDSISWKLEVTARTPGLDYHAEFDVPVFKTPESDPNFVIDESLIAQYAAPDDPDRDLREAGVIRTPSPTGEGSRFVFPMARQLRGAIVLTIVAAAFAGVPVVMWLSTDFGWVEMIFSVVFGFFGLIFAVIAADLWLYRSVVDASPRSLTVTGGLFGRGKQHWVAADEVVEIKTPSNFESDTQKYYDIVIVCLDGRKITAGKRIPGNRLAMSVIQQIQQAMCQPR